MKRPHTRDNTTVMMSDNKNELFHVKLSLDSSNTVITALIDTGATISAIHPDVLRLLNIRITKLANPITIVGVAGTRHNVHGVVTLKFFMASTSFEHIFHVCEIHGIKMVLGTDFLRKYDGDVLISTSQLSTRKGKFPLQPISTSHVTAYATGLHVDDKRKRKRQQASFTPISDVTNDTLVVGEERPLSNLRFNTNGATSAQLETWTTLFPPISQDDTRVTSLISEFERTIAYDGKPGTVQNATHYAELTDPNVTIAHRNRPMSPEHRVIFHNQIKTWLENDVIESADSRHNSPPVIVAKPDGGHRICLDLRELNKHIKRIHYPVPHPHDCFDRMTKAKYFTKFDAKEAFLQIPLHPACRDLFAFNVPAMARDPGHTGQSLARQYRFKRMPYGLNNASEVFQKVIDYVLRDEIADGICTVYIDDIIVHTNANVDEHLSHVYKVFDLLKKAGLRIKPAKMAIAQTEIDFLGAIVDRSGVRVNQKRCEKVQNYPTPRDKTELKRFLGMVSFVRRFIKDFAHIAQPLTDMTADRNAFKWSRGEQNAFEILKTALTEAPVLALPDWDKPFRLYADASNLAIGATLMQEHDGQLKPIAYASRVLSTTERRWQTTEKEAFALYWATKHFEEYIKGSKLRINRWDRINYDASY